MPVLEVEKQSERIEFEEKFERKVKPFGKGGAYINAPKRFVGRTVIVVVLKEVKQWLEGYRKKYAKSKKVAFPGPDNIEKIRQESD